MFAISRLNKSRLANWWWTVDKVTLGIVLAIMFIGAFLVFSASIPVAQTLIRNGHHISEYHFIKQQLKFIPCAIIIIVGHLPVGAGTGEGRWDSEFGV